jgi:hypothetical protein
MQEADQFASIAEGQHLGAIKCEPPLLIRPMQEVNVYP